MAQQWIRCPRCGRANAWNNAYCASCGAPLSPPAYRPAPPPGAHPRKSRRWLTCGVALLLVACLGGSALGIVGWFYGDQLIAWLERVTQDTDPGWSTPTPAPEAAFVYGPVIVTAENGATVTLPTFGSRESVTATFTQILSPTGEIMDNALVVSGEYVLRVDNPTALSGDVLLALPLATALLPADWNPAGLTPEVFEPASGQWEAVGQVISYDEAEQRVLFDAPFALPTVTGSRPSGMMALRYQSAERRYRIRLRFFSNWVTFVPNPTNFEIEYYPISGLSYSIRSDIEWQCDNPWATESKVPDYAEDLHHALETGYAGLLQIEQTTGPLFKPLNGVQKVTVIDIGAVEGQTSLFWGTIKISNSRIASYAQLEQVATHELTHLLCDQYYNSASAAANRWFFEATAEYFAARARGLSPAARGQHYASPAVVSDVYLSIPLIASNVSSYYPAGHFLDWCSTRYGASVVPTAIVYGSYHLVDRNDATHFSEALKLHGEPGGINAAYGAYIRDLLSKPEDYGGANATFKSNITAYAATQGHASATQFDNYVTYIKLTRSLPPLAATGVYVQGRNSDSALLVIDSSGSSGGALQATTYDFAGGNNVTYQNTAAIDAGLAFPYPQPLTVADFGRLEGKKQLEQLIANTSTSQAAQVEVLYYLLRPPPVTAVEDGRVTWSCANLGNMPRELIQGYHIYKNGARLTTAPIPVPAEGWDQYFESDQITAGDTLMVQIVDHAGHAWPPVSTPQAPLTPTPTPTLTPTPTPEGQPPLEVTPTPETGHTPGQAALTLVLQPGQKVQITIQENGLQRACTAGDCSGNADPWGTGLLMAMWYTVERVEGDTVYLNQPESFYSSKITLVLHRDQNLLDLYDDLSDNYSDENKMLHDEIHNAYVGLPLQSNVVNQWYFALMPPDAAGKVTGEHVETCSSVDAERPSCWCHAGPEPDCTYSSNSTKFWADQGTTLEITLNVE